MKHRRKTEKQEAYDADGELNLAIGGVWRAIGDLKGQVWRAESYFRERRGRVPEEGLQTLQGIFYGGGMNYFARNTGHLDVRARERQRGAIPLGMRYLEGEEFLGLRKYISIFYIYEALMEGNADIKEDRERNIIYLGRCECIHGGEWVTRCF